MVVGWSGPPAHCCAPSLFIGTFEAIIKWHFFRPLDLYQSVVNQPLPGGYPTGRRCDGLFARPDRYLGRHLLDPAIQGIPFSPWEADSSSAKVGPAIAERASSLLPHDATPSRLRRWPGGFVDRLVAWWDLHLAKEMGRTSAHCRKQLGKEALPRHWSAKWSEDGGTNHAGLSLISKRGSAK